MKELGKRFRGLFVLLLAATFFLQGGWFMPAEAATGDEYLIILQNAHPASSNIEGVPDPYPDVQLKPHFFDARALGVYKSSNGKITELVGESDYPYITGITPGLVRSRVSTRLLLKKEQLYMLPGQEADP